MAWGGLCVFPGLMRVLESAWRDQPDTRTARVEPGCFVFGCGDRI